jgi:anaerobic selenocysteine-containing dehydrogenase
MTLEHKPTFCRICEPLCGMVATVEDGRLVALRPDKDHPLSAGFACQKGIAFTEVVNDPDRVTTPLRRRADGGFEPVSWDDALTDIAKRLGEIHRRHGSGGIAWYYGNPGAFSYAHTLSLAMFMAGLGPRLHVFTAGSQDINNRFVASQLLYGSPLAIPIPDVLRTDLLVVIGANPVVSHGSAVTVPRIKDRMHDIVKRGGRVLVVDPRRTETAAQFEWLGIIPDGDAFLLLSLLQVLFAEDLVDAAAGRQAEGIAWLQRLAAPFSPEATQRHTGIDPSSVRSLARDLARIPRAAVYGRVGTSTGQNGTLTTYLLDAVNLVAGNLDRPGGSMFGRFGLPAERWLMKAAAAVLRTSYTRRRSRIGGFPSVLMSEPAGVMAKEITTAGPGQVKALLVSAGNPVLSVPNGDELETALGELELMVGIDLYVNETLAHCDYVLPATTMYERDDFPLAFQTLQPTPFRQATEAVIAPVGQARAEWEVIDEITRRLWRRTPGLVALAFARKALQLFGIGLSPRLLMDAVIRLGDGGDRFGLRRRGLSFARLTAKHPHGAVLAPGLRAGVLADIVVYRGGRVRLEHDEIAAEVEGLSRRRGLEGYPLRLIGMREARSENTWMHNAPLLMRGGRMQHARMHIDDAAAANIVDGDMVRIASPNGEIELPVTVTKDIVAGVIAVPHGWGHKGTGGWRLANGAGGANVNRLMSSAPEDLEKLAGMARLTGVPVRVERADAAVGQW